ncbi:hypothetical protein IPV09_13875 [Tessaracoccus sp. SD287]|uniref:hypothetical protein n=1 Tax=Tessaracoccus sp. SD287 TaxID=2782008 RepID=UPI001A969515|nr:hypothetical protein [Tessaracoccus sp. SD287]MBO1032423.1 hypothetical protein [Tessaracoccus sp. SD287]
MKTRLLAVSLLVLSLVAVPTAANAATSDTPTRLAVSSGTQIGTGSGTATPSNIWCAWLRICLS